MYRKAGRWCLALVMTALCLVSTAPAMSPPSQLEPFEVGTFSQWRSSLKRPTWVVFTATWCATCPAVVSDLIRAARQHPQQPVVWAVLIDVAPGEEDARFWSRHAHLRGADRVLGFEGIPQAIRYAVDPGWRGTVPHVALLEPGGRMALFSGQPPASALKR